MHSSEKHSKFGCLFPQVTSSLKNSKKECQRIVVHYTISIYWSVKLCKDVEWVFVLRAPSVSCCIRGSRPSLAAGSPTDATTAAFHCSRLSANITVTEGLRLDSRKHSWAPERVQWERMLNGFHFASCRWLRITGRYTIYWPTHWLVPQFGCPKGSLHSSLGIRLRCYTGRRLASPSLPSPAKVLGWWFSLLQCTVSDSQDAVWSRNAEWTADGALEKKRCSHAVERSSGWTWAGE